MRKFKITLAIFILFYSLTTYASTISIIGTDVRVREEATTSSKILKSVNTGEVFELLEEIDSGNGCEDKWYKIKNDKLENGYVCSSFVIKIDEEYVEPSEEEPIVIIDYTKESLMELGFPESYTEKLLTLHSKYPNWQFKPYKVNYDFNNIVNIEHQSSGRSLLEDTSKSRDGLKSTASWSYSFKTNVFSNNFIGGGKYWFAASTSTIGYYLDPRNFLNEKQIFMFESLSYNKDLHTLSGIKNMLKGTFMENLKADDDHLCADAFLDAAKTYNISPYLLISRVIQEVGSNGSTIVSGKVSGYEGYFNFYNINAYGSNNTQTINNGLAYAKEKGWNTRYKAIVGGAVFLASNYVKVGQDTLYLQKWDLVGEIGTHQYMQNIEAPASESKSTYSGYNKLGILNSYFAFTIPVFNNMPEKTTLPNSGNPNNYLKTLSYNGSYLFTDYTEETEFNINLYYGTNDISIDATKIASTATISGTGTIGITDNKQDIEIDVTAQNGDVRKYIIHVTREEKVGDVSVDISEVTRLSDLITDDKYLIGIEVGTEINTINDKFKEIEPNLEIEWKDINNNPKVDGKVCSGDKIKLKTDREEKELILLIYGDVNLDGEISSSDYFLIKNSIMGTMEISEFQKLVADVNKDGEVTSGDYFLVKNTIMGTMTIEQR